MHEDSDQKQLATQPRHSTKSRPRADVCGKVLDFEAARRDRGLTQKEAADEIGVSLGTLRGWGERIARSGLTPVQRAFFESPDGVQFLSTLFTAALFVMNVRGGLSVSTMRTFFTLSGLNTQVASSESTLLRARRRMIDAIAAWGDTQDTVLAEKMEPKDVLACVDENFHHGMMLVAMDPVSGFLFTEKFAERRDSKTWATTMRESLAKWPVRLLALLGDEAKGIARCALSELGVLKFSDLFHVLYEVGRGTGAALAHRVDHARQAVETAREALSDAEAGRTHAPDGKAARAAVCEIMADDDVKKAEASLVAVEAQRSEVRATVRAFSDSYSPVDLPTGGLLTPSQITTRLRERFGAIGAAVQQAGLAAAERPQRSLAKARRVIPSLIAMVEAWHRLTTERITALGMSDFETQWIRETLLPMVYLDCVAPRGRDQEIRAQRRNVRDLLSQKIPEAGSPWTTWTSDTKVRILSAVESCADLFARASSCVEGRNGQLSLHHHHTHQLSAALLKALTVIHNYVVTRSDGSTAARRFTGQNHEDLFLHLVSVMPVPARPRVRKSKTRLPLLATG